MPMFCPLDLEQGSHFLTNFHIAQRGNEQRSLSGQVFQWELWTFCMLRAGMEVGRTRLRFSKICSFFFYIYKCLSACMHACHMHAVPMEARRGNPIPWLPVARGCLTWVLGTDTSLTCSDFQSLEPQLSQLIPRIQPSSAPALVSSGDFKPLFP